MSIRLHKYVASCGRASRREAERLMAAGRVAVNGKPVSEPGALVDPERDRVTVDGVAVRERRVRWIALNKPRGADVTRHDPHSELSIYDLLPRELAHLFYVGRLDRESEGLLLMTNDGAKAHAIQHPSGAVDREYEVEVAGSEVLAKVSRLARGVALEDGTARPVDIGVSFGSRGEATLRLVLREGRKREVRRMMAAVGLGLRRLTRTRFGSVSLGSLPAGEWRDLTEREMDRLTQAPKNVAGAATRDRRGLRKRRGLQG